MASSIIKVYNILMTYKVLRHEKKISSTIKCYGQGFEAVILLVGFIKHSFDSVIVYSANAEIIGLFCSCCWKMLILQFHRLIKDMHVLTDKGPVRTSFHSNPTKLNMCKVELPCISLHMKSCIYFHIRRWWIFTYRNCMPRTQTGSGYTRKHLLYHTPLIFML